MTEAITATVTLRFDVPEGLDPEAQRDRISDDIGRLYDADCTNGIACTGFAVGAVKRPPTSRVHVLCACCGSPDIRADAYASWDVEAGAWVMHSVYDDKTCEKCGSSCSLIEVDEATGLEIQAFAMVEDEDGARIAETGEAPAFFDVSVTTQPTECGEIHALHDMDDLTFDQMNKAVAIMQDLYPLAPVTFQPEGMGQ